MLSFNNLTMRKDPFPIGLAPQVFDVHLYEALIADFPPDSIFQAMGDGTDANKLSLSERNRPRYYAEFLKTHTLWRLFYTYVKTAFVPQILAVMKAHECSLPDHPYTARFEFSLIPANGGFIRPHTDTSKKVVSLVIPMVRPGEWDTAWGGGTDILEPRHHNECSVFPCLQVAHSTGMPLVDYEVDLLEFDVVSTFAFDPNQAAVMLKTKNSWHSVGPLHGPTGSKRRSLTVMVERPT